MSNALGQKKAVVQAVTNILGSSFQSNSTVVKDVITQDQLTAVRKEVFDGIVSGKIAYNGDIDINDTKALNRYVNGMVQNHFRKAKELNGGVKYQPENPGSGRRDATLSNLKKLLKKYEEGSEQFNQVLKAINNREAELSEERAAAAAARKQEKIAKSIDTSVLPSELADAIENVTNV